MTTSASEKRKLRQALAGSSTTMTFNTYRDRAISDLDLENHGRHAKGAEVIGAKAAVRYPRLPENNPFTTDISGVEPPTGIDINWQEPNGTPAEIAESLREASSVLLVSGADDAVATASTIPSFGAKQASAVSTSAADASNFIRRARKL
jgi:hypothetical protein